MQNTALKLLKKIEENGFEAYIVGGYVRDYLLNRKSNDIDICTNAKPRELKEIFKDVLLPNEQYGSVTIYYNKIRFEITTFRREIKYENNRLPVKIEYIDSLEEDIKRRDFTINAMCMDSDGKIIDILNGQADLQAKVIKMIGNPLNRLKEDILRILRAIRFATVLNFQMDDELKNAIIDSGYLISKLSPFRKKEELDKIFASSNSKYGIGLLKDLKLDIYLDINLDDVVVTTSSIGIWSQIDAINKYQFTNNEKESIIKLNELKSLDLFDPFVLYEYGLYLVMIAGEIKGIHRKDILEKYNSLSIKSIKDIAISSLEICDLLNITPGPILKDINKDLETQLLKKNVENNKVSITNYLINKY